MTDADGAAAPAPPAPAPPAPAPAAPASAAPASAAPASAAPASAAAPLAGQIVAAQAGAVAGPPQAEASLAGALGAAAVALCVVLGLIWLAQKVVRLRGFAQLRRLAPMRRFGLAPGASGPLAVAAQASLDARRKLVLVACAGRQVLLLTGGPADLVVGWLPPDAAGPARDRPPEAAR